MIARSPSRRVHSNQAGLHPRLYDIVERHRRYPFQRPIATHNRRIFEAVNERVAGHRGALILDSFCGVGASTATLAHTHPQALVVGVDKSAHRLRRHPELPDNALLARAETEDFWRLALEHRWRPEAHYLLYPNPWPKAAQLQRRVHGSPLLPALLQLGGKIELRSNWWLYLAEFAAAAGLCGWQARLRRLGTTPALTPFERKYRDSGQPLWQLHCQSADTAL